MRQIDLNCDLGESYGKFVIGDDAAIMPYISSANIGCGFHGGDPSVIRRAIRLAKTHGVAVGAHPSFPDLVGFGLRAMDTPPEALEDMVLYQISAIAGIARAEGTVLHHVKLHGALYMVAARDLRVATAVARAVAAFDSSLAVYGIGQMLDACRALGLPVAAEVFAGRVYEPDGWPRTRARPDALMTDPAEVIAQILTFVDEQRATTSDGTVVPIPADTVCVHVETSEDVSAAKQLKAGLERAGISIRPTRRA